MEDVKGYAARQGTEKRSVCSAIQHAAAAKVKDYAIDNATNRPPLPPKLEARLTDIAQRQLADPTRLPPEDWITLACLTDNQSSDFHPDANAFYLKAKEVARQLNTAAGSAGVTPTLQEIGIRTLQALILANPRLDFLKTADTLGIPLPKDAADATVATQARNDEQENQPRKLAAPVQIQKKSFFQKNLNELERNILEKTFSILKFLFSLFTIIIIWIFIAYIFRGCNFIHPD